jgi:ferredoxin-type protein NapH
MSRTGQATAQLREIKETSETERRLVSSAKERKHRLGRVQKSRTAKQLVMGGGFLGLLAFGWVYPLIGYFIPACMLLGIGVALFRGRTWCNWLCPRGSFADALLKRVSPGRRIPEAFRSLSVRIGMIAFLMAILAFQIARLWPDAYTMGGFFVLLLTITTGVGIPLALGFHQRTWCYICPIGTMSSWVGAKRRPLAMEKESCTECGLCARVCPMQLTPRELKDTDRMSHRGDCLKCGLCTESCPSGALSFESEPASHVRQAS